MSITHVPDEGLLVFDHEIAAPVEDVFGIPGPRTAGPLVARRLARAPHRRCRGACRQRHAALSMIDELTPPVSCILQSRF